MKISKLFHWLYAVIMLLPIFAIGVTCGYAMFNKNAYQSFSGTHTYKETLSVETQNDLISGMNYYTLTAQPYISGSSSFKGIYNVQNLIVSYNNEQLFNSNDYQYSYYAITPYSTTTLKVYGQNIQKTADNEVELTEIESILNEDMRIDMLIFDNPIVSGNLTSFVQNLKYDSYYVNTKLNDAFYYAIDSVQQSPLFNWAENSFLVAPFAYIVSLFSMPTNSPIVMFLSYWLSISIIWLVFDLIMYIPLLVHRWLDKGVLE